MSNGKHGNNSHKGLVILIVVILIVAILAVGLVVEFSVVFSVLWVVEVTDCEVAFDCSVLSVFPELFPHPAKEMRKTISKEKLIILFIRLPYFESREIIEFI